jgi:hypothetical protein
MYQRPTVTTPLVPLVVQTEAVLELYVTARVFGGDVDGGAVGLDTVLVTVVVVGVLKTRS